MVLENKLKYYLRQHLIGTSSGGKMEKILIKTSSGSWKLVMSQSKHD